MIHHSNKQFNIYKDGLDLEFLRNYCYEHGKTHFMKRGDIFQKAQESSQYLAYVEHGVFKYMVHNDEDNKDYCTGFAFEGEFVADYPNCLLGKKAVITIVAGTACKVFLISGKELEILFTSTHDNGLRQTIAEHLFTQVYTQHLDSYRFTTRERYKRLLHRCPELIQSINLKDIASYLKVTPTTISNIRREITFNQ